MREEEGLTPAEREFEQALAGLQPAGAAIDRDQLLYRAGYAAGSRKAGPWKAMAALLTIGLATSLVARGLTNRSPDVQIARRSVGVQPLPVTARQDSPAAEPAGPQPRYLLLRNEVLEKGMAALPQGDFSGQTALPRQPTLQDPLGESPEPAKPIVSHRLPIMDYILLGGRS